MSVLFVNKQTTPVPSVPSLKDPQVEQVLGTFRRYLEGFSRQFNASLDAQKIRERSFIITKGQDGLFSMHLQNAFIGPDGLFHPINRARSAWAMRFDGTTDLFEILYAAPGMDPISWTQLWSTSSSGIPTFSQNIRWKSGTPFWGELDHANTANRVYAFPDASGTVPLKESAETISGAWVFSEDVVSLKNLKWASGTSTFYGILDHANSADRTYTFQNRNGTIADDTDIDGRVAVAGDTMTGTLDMGANKVTTTYVPVNGPDLTNKTYVDATVAAAGHDAVTVGDSATIDHSLSGQEITSHLKLASSSVSADTNLDATHCVLRVDASGATRTMNLPAAAGASGRVYHIKKMDATANTVVVDGSGAETIDGAATYTLTTQYESVMITSNGTSWDVI